MPLLGVVGGDETEGFKESTADLVTAWRAHGGAASYREMPGCNHFAVLAQTSMATLYEWW